MRSPPTPANYSVPSVGCVALEPILNCVSVSVLGFRIHALIDTGADISIFSWDVASRIGVKIDPNSTRKRILTNASGLPILVRGIADLEIRLGPHCRCTHTFQVGEISQSCILGMDFLKRRRGMIDTHGGVLLLDGKDEVPMVCRDSVEKETDVSHAVHLAETVVVPPRHEVLVHIVLR